MFNKLQKKILLLNMALISVVMLLAFVTVYATTWQSIQSENLRKLNMQAPTLESYMEGEPHSGDSGARVSYTVSSDYTLSFSVRVDDDGSILGINSIIDMPGETYAEAVRMALAGDGGGVITLGNKDWMYKIDYSAHIRMTNGKQTVTQEGRHIFFLDITQSRLTMRNLLLTLSVVSVAVLIIFYFISLFFSRRAVKPIAEAWEKQKQFVADASHELKTPLTIINANCDALLESKDETVESQRKWIDYIQIGTDRMSNLIGQLLVLAKTDDMNGMTALENVDISALALEIVRAFEAIAHKKGIDLVYNITPDIVIRSDREKISAIMTILLENAVKYSDSSIDVKLERIKRSVWFTVKNDGNGISRDDLPKVFDRFYRGDQSREGNNSYGLGLSIAKSIVEGLNGTISAASKTGEYTVFTVVLPV